MLCSRDYDVLCPASQRMAYGTDGVLSGWTLTSASVDFAANGVVANQVVRIEKATVIKGSGDVLAIESAVGGVLTLRRIGQVAGVGQTPPAATAVTFEIKTLSPQIEEESFDLNRRFGIDPLVPGRTPSDEYDLRDLRMACVRQVICNRYQQEARDKENDFWPKYGEHRKLLADVIERVRVRWGPSGDTLPSTSIFGMRIDR